MPAQLERSFEKFMGGPTQRPETRLHVTLDTRGVLTFNAACYQELGKPRSVYLHFSRDLDTIAVEPVDSVHISAAFPFRTNGTARYINTAPFCRHFRIKFDTTQRFVSPDLRDGALHLKLRETVSIARERKNK